ncbi:MAG: RNA 2'-phosphotransferase [Rhodobacteraceae bacterium]|nr:RNA 2'-phosphotransferase [Paracoccaceae bacterium]
MSIGEISKFLSFVLRHKPDSIGLVLDSEGWAEVSDIIEKADMPITQAQIEAAVATSDKQRFALTDDKRRIRANQGHSIEVDLGLESVKPPARLFHGTATRFVVPILAAGLLKQARQHVHLSVDLETASKVGARHGKLAIFEVRALEMHEEGHRFYLSKNGVWLVEHVPVGFLDLR